VEINITALDVLFYLALGLLLLVSGGIIYLTSVEWRDRRRQSNDQRLKR
jgi:hypothetical protein